MRRLSQRKTRLWHQNYLHYRYLWPNIHWATNAAKSSINSDNPVVLDIGCGQKPYKDLFDKCSYLGVNYSSFDADPDVVADALVLPIKSNSIDIVFSTQVIEHVHEPIVMIQECFRVLKPSGALVLTGPFYWPIHEAPYDYYRYTKYGFDYMLKKAGFKSWDIRPDGGDWAQIFLSINLKIPKILFPIRILMNLLGLLGDKLSKDNNVPANYTLVAYK